MTKPARRNNPLPGILLILLLIAAIGSQESRAANLRILYSNDVMGELDDCG